MSTVANHLAALICGLSEDTLPSEITSKARTCLLNGFGIAYAGLGTPYHPIAETAATSMYGDGNDATCLASGTRSTITGAILANGALFHGRAQEDTCGAAHLGAVIIPLLTALIESGRAKPADLIPALVAGYEAGGIFEELFAVETTPSGFRATTLYGVTAAAAATARLLRLSPKQTVAALNNAVSFSGGLLQSFVEGTDEWRYQVGTTAQLGWTATELARAGSTSASSAFEGSKGLVQAFAKREIDIGEITQRLGSHWQTLRVAFKPFPVCAFNQTPVTAVLELRSRIGSKPIASVAVYMNPYECSYAGMDSKGPFDSISGTLMSIPFCISLTLLRGAPSMRMMTVYDDKEVNTLVENTELIAEPSIPVLGCRIVVKMRDDTAEEFLCEMKPSDYAYDFEDLRQRLKDTVAQEGLDEKSVDDIATFSASPGTVPLETVFNAFSRRA